MTMLSVNNEIIVDEDDLVEMLLQGLTLTQVTMNNTTAVDTYNHFCDLFLMNTRIDAEVVAESADKYSYRNVDNWWMPHRYKQLDMMEYLLDKVMKDLNCLDDVYVLDHSKEWDRVRLEMSLYNQRGLLPMLKFLVYMVDNMREHKVVWGVGRGSSVASYVLYLIGVHRINSVKYNLDFKEFLR